VEKISGMMVFRVHLILALLLMTAFGAWSCSKGDNSGKTVSITIGTPHNESSALVYIAEEQRFFARHGLHATIRNYDFGALALKGMLRGEVDIALATEFPLVIMAFRKERVRTIGSVGEFEFVYLVGRKDRGIEKISDLKGKRVATARGTIAEFHLGRYLDLHGMNLAEITLVDMQSSEQLADAVVNGNIDAVVTQHPYVASAEELLGANTFVWPVQSGQAMFTPAICRGEWIRDHPGLVTRLLNSLAQAEEYAMSHPVETEAILQKRLNLKPSYAKTVRLRSQLSLSLDQSLIAAMEDEARWMIKNNLTKEKDVPNFLDYIYEDGLKVVRPDAVKIIR
jgi:NitT/TauT family transport system substrate-binding protein